MKEWRDGRKDERMKVYRDGKGRKRLRGGEEGWRKRVMKERRKRKDREKWKGRDGGSSLARSSIGKINK